MGEAPPFDVVAAARTGARDLGAQIAELTLELAAQQSLVAAQQRRIVELEAAAATGPGAAAAPESEPETETA